MVQGDGHGGCTEAWRWIAYPLRPTGALKTGVMRQIGGPVNADLNYQGLPQHKIFMIETVLNG
jgi:hypothetical protein